MTRTHTEREPKAEAPGALEPSTQAPARQARRRSRVVGTVAVLAIGVATTTGVVLTRDGGGKGTTSTASRLSTAAIVRRDLSDVVRVDGTLGYAGTFTYNGPDGTLTWLPQPGQLITRGHRLVAVDDHDVPLFYGATPLWRTLQDGVDDGSDVRELQANLNALHYGELAVDGHFGPETRDAVENWQHDLRRDRTGVVAKGDIVIAPGAVRVQSVAGTLGGTAHLQVLQAVGTDRLVTVPLPAGQQQLVQIGQQVDVELPGRAVTSGHVADIGTVATAGSPPGQTPGAASGSGGQPAPPGQGVATATIPVYVQLDVPKAAGRLDGAPVTVNFSGRISRGVLAVPVSALIALGPHSYAVVVVDAAGRKRTVPVTLGTFGSGQVAVTGAGLVEGQRVEVPSS